MAGKQEPARKGREYIIDKSGIVSPIRPGEKYKINRD